MSPYTTLDVSIADIKLFALLAEEKNFSRVALLASMSQPTLSRRISQMETTLGMRLIDRDSRPVRLTDEGSTFYHGCKQLLAQFDSTLQMARSSARSSRNALSVAAVDSGNEIISLPSISRSILIDRPGMDITMSYLPFSAWRARMLSGEIDVYLTAQFETLDLPPSLTWEQITVCSKDVVMLESNPLAARPSIRFEDLKDQYFVMTSPDESAAYVRYVTGLCAEHGFRPSIARYVPHASNLIAGLRRANEVIICDMFLKDLDNAALRRFPLPGVTSGLVAVWREDSRNANISLFIDYLRRHYASMGYQVCNTI